MSSDSEDAPYRYRAGATPFFVALVKAQVVVPCVGCCSSGSRHCPQPVPSHYHQSCVGQAARGTRLLVQNRNYGLLASTGTDDQRSALPRSVGSPPFLGSEDEFFYHTSSRRYRLLSLNCWLNELRLIGALVLRVEVPFP